MNAGMSHAYESHFGPASEAINIAEFIQSANEEDSILLGHTGVFSPSPDAVQGLDAWRSLSEEEKNAVAAECSVEDIKTTLVDTVNDPIYAAHLLRSHNASVHMTYETAETTNRRKRRRLADPSLERPEAKDLNQALQGVKLQSWPLSLDSALFMRAPKNSDQNALHRVKRMSKAPLTDPRQALITITVHNRLTWSHNYLQRSSQHALLSSNTLTDLFETMPCTANEQAKARMEDGRVVGWEDAKPSEWDSGYVICIEDVAYGDGQTEPDYADKLIAHLQKFPNAKRPNLKKGPPMDQVPLSSLSLHLHEPYWLLHQGSCEHFLVVDQIRLLNSTDPQVGYPLTLHATPVLLDLCRACAKVPASLSVTGDVRLGESPCLLCGTCWRAMGQPKDGQAIVAPLPKHQVGW